MMNDHEKIMSKKLLKCLTGDEVLSLAQTVTNSKVCFMSEAEAIKAIVEYSESIQELLKRRKLKKEVLFRYLLKENVSVSLNAEKQEYVDAIIRHWQKPNQVVKAEQSPQAHPEPKPVNVTVQETTYQQNVQNITIQQNFFQQHISNTIQIAPPPTTPAQPNQHQQLAETFASWFYTMLNQSVDAGTTYGPQHFFPDCQMNILVASAPANPPEHYASGEAVCKRLSKFIHEDGVQFHPNISLEGVQGSETAQGVMLIKVCGTVQKQAQGVGVFEQHFRLIRDIGLGNNWRVKSTNLGLTNVIPRLPVTLAVTGGLPALE